MGKKQKTWDMCWTTESEIKWLETIGSTAKQNYYSKVDLLIKYRKAINKRIRWDSIEKEKVIYVVEKMISNLKEKT